MSNNKIDMRTVFNAAAVGAQMALFASFITLAGPVLAGVVPAVLPWAMAAAATCGAAGSIGVFTGGNEHIPEIFYVPGRRYFLSKT